MQHGAQRLDGNQVFCTLCLTTATADGSGLPASTRGSSLRRRVHTVLAVMADVVSALSIGTDVTASFVDETRAVWSTRGYRGARGLKEERGHFIDFVVEGRRIGPARPWSRQCTRRRDPIGQTSEGYWHSMCCDVRSGGLVVHRSHGFVRAVIA